MKSSLQNSVVVLLGLLSSFTPGLCGVIAPRGIETGPLNVAAMPGDTVVLSCDSDGVASSNIRWYEYVSDPGGVIISENGTVMPGHPNSARYAILQPTSDAHNLQISPVEYEDGGYYQCMDSNAVPPSTVQLGAQLITIEAEPNCTSQIPNDGFVILGQYYTVECEVGFKAANNTGKPLMTWTGPDPHSAFYRTIYNRVWSGVSFTVEKHFDARNYVCKTNFTSDGFLAPDSAGNAPTWMHMHPDNQMFVHYAPMNMTAWPITASYEIGDCITCWADANPAPIYSWQSLRTSEFFYNQTFCTRADMVGYQLMRCTARNTMQGDDYTSDYFADVYVNAPTTTGPSTTTVTTTPVPAEGACGDVTGRWEATDPAAALCLTVDHEGNAGQMVGLFLNGTNTYWLQIRGKTKVDNYDELGWILIWPSSSVGVTSYAAECISCHGDETMIANGITRTTKESEFCGTGGTVHHDATLTFHRVPTSWPCSSSLAQMQKNIAQAQLGLLHQTQ